MTDARPDLPPTDPNPDGPLHDLLIVGSGPTGIAIGAAARQAGLDVLLLDRGGLCASLQAWPTDVRFFTTRDKLEIAKVPFAIPDDKPTRQQALAYYQGVARRYQVPLALFEEVHEVTRGDDGVFTVVSRLRTDANGPARHAAGGTLGADGARVLRRARAVALATGYYEQPERLGVPGEDLPFVHHRYIEPWQHYGRRVLLVGGGNTASEAALDLWRHGAGEVTLVHRRDEIKPSVKFWLAPDIRNRIEEGSIIGRFDTVVERFEPGGGVVVRGPNGLETLAVDAAYVLIGYAPDAELQRRCGIVLDPETRIPAHDPETCESNVPGLYVAGTLQAGTRTDRIFIENSRDHGDKIVAHWLEQRGRTADAAARRGDLVYS